MDINPIMTPEELKEFLIQEKIFLDGVKLGKILPSPKKFNSLGQRIVIKQKKNKYTKK